MHVDVLMAVASEPKLGVFGDGFDVVDVHFDGMYECRADSGRR